MAMPLVIRKPSVYTSALKQESTEPLQIGLSFGGTITDAQASEIADLAKAIRETTRDITFFWIRFNEGDDTILPALASFGKELIGASTVSSFALEDNVGEAELRCLRDFLVQNDTIRGVKFLRTNLCISSCALIRDFFIHNSALRVLDLSSNSMIGDVAIKDILNSIRQGGSSLELLNIAEHIVDEEDVDSSRGISESGVEFIASFVSKTPSLTSLKLRIRELSDEGLGNLSVVFAKKTCRVSRLEVGGRFGDSGIKILAEALKINRSLKIITISHYRRFTDVGGRAILSAVNDVGSWESVRGSNNVLRSVYISEQPNLSVSDAIISKLQAISSADTCVALQRKVWRYLDSHMNEISNVGLQLNHMPKAISFVNKRGGLDATFRLTKHWNVQELFADRNPDRARMERIEHENRMLKELLELEKEFNASLRRENAFLKDKTRCCWIPVLKALELWHVFIELLREI